VFRKRHLHVVFRFDQATIHKEKAKHIFTGLCIASSVDGVDGMEYAPLFTNPTDFQIKTDPETRIVLLLAWVSGVCVSNVQGACQLVYAKSTISNFEGPHSARKCFCMTIDLVLLELIGPHGSVYRLWISVMISVDVFFW
jgi:hypothetical protein